MLYLDSKFLLYGGLYALEHELKLNLFVVQIRGVFRGPCARPLPPLQVKFIVLKFNVKNMLNFEHFRKCTPEMYLGYPVKRFLNTSLVQMQV